MASEKLDDKSKVGIAAPILYTLAIVGVSYAVLSALEGEPTYVLIGFGLAIVFAVAGYFASSTWRNGAEQRRRAFERKKAVAPRHAKPPAESGGTEPRPPQNIQEREAAEAWRDEGGA